MTLEECRNNIGRKVVYTPFEGCDTSLLEYGVIVSANLTLALPAPEGMYNN